VSTVFLYNYCMTETTYTSLRQSLASVLDRVANDREVVIIRRKGEQRVALVPADELAGLMETAHLLRSPRNAQRLLSALRRATSGKGKPEASSKALDKLRREMGVGGGRWARCCFSSGIPAGFAVLGGKRSQGCAAGFRIDRGDFAGSFYWVGKTGAAEIRFGGLLVAPNHAGASPSVSRECGADRFSAGAVSLLGAGPVLMALKIP
jgi:antitoxin YefM